jgi:hypothetical protein
MCPVDLDMEFINGLGGLNGSGTLAIDYATEFGISLFLAGESGIGLTLTSLSIPSF